MRRAVDGRFLQRAQGLGLARGAGLFHIHKLALGAVQADFQLFDFLALPDQHIAQLLDLPFLLGDHHLQPDQMGIVHDFFALDALVGRNAVYAMS